MSTLKVTPIYGSTGHHPSSSSISLPPSSTLVEYGGVRVLVNVGSDESSGPSSLPPLDLNIDAIIITDSSLHALGGLPQYMNLRAKQKYAEYGDVKNMHDDVPIYATFPLLKMGQMNLYDHHSNLALDGGNPGYSLEDVDELFSPSLDSIGSTNGSTNMNEAGTDSRKNRSRAIQTLKYAQTIILNCPSTGKPAISITPHRAGHTIGAAYYILTRLADETEVVVAPTYHHAKEKHLDSSDLYKYASACDVLITTCGGPGGDLGQLYVTTGENKKSILNPPSVGRDEGELVEYILSTLRRGGNVLLPVDASGRVLELLYLLNQHWERQRLGSTYNLCWVGSMVHNTIEFARSQLEWMATPLGAQFDSGRGHPFSCKSVQMFSTVAEMESACFGNGGVEAESMNGNPTCVLASGCSLDCGPARDLFLKWSENADNAVIFTDSRRAVQRFNVLESRRSGIFGGVVTSSTDQQMLETSVKDVVTSNLGTINTATGSETPNIVQEEEEGRKMINIGALVSSENVSIYSTSAQLLKKWCEAKAAKEEMADSVECDVLVPKRTPLAGTELKVYLAQEESKRQKRKAEEERRAMLREVELVKGRLRVTEEDNTAGTSTIGSGAVSGQALSKQADADAPTSSSTSRPKKKSRFDANLFLKFSKPCHMTFEVREEAVGIGQPDSIAKYGIGESIGKAGEVLEDDYGIAVQADRFVDIVTGVDPSKFVGSSGKIGENVLRRGLGYGNDSKSSSKVIEDATNIVEDEEFALEAADLSEGTGIIRGRNGRPPVKVTTEPRKLEVLAEIAYVPLEGQVDARAARQSIRALQPRQVVIIGAGRPKIPDLVSDKRTSIFSEVVKGRDLVFAPSDGETVELSVGHAAYSVRLVDTPYITREEQQRILEKNEEVLNIEVSESKVGDCTVSLLDYVATGQRVATDGSFVVAPNGKKDRKRPNIMLSHGEVLLTDLRSELIAEGMKAEYSAHTGYAQLVVNGRVVVRKDQSSGRINVEGPLCEDFFRVRNVVCGQYVSL